ncbi:hypothetical protein GCM10023196_061440 [Actinoallomurus vinaceus]|uniref:Uncharacterized protein n=1 Tax=Actinoallomurus vinaceus TaxID=1080074 RepID=A0ABP8UHL1_9ACTN
MPHRGGGPGHDHERLTGLTSGAVHEVKRVVHGGRDISVGARTQPGADLPGTAERTQMKVPHGFSVTGLLYPKGHAGQRRCALRWCAHHFTQGSGRAAHSLRRSGASICRLP